MIAPDIFKDVTSPGEAAALFQFQSSEFEQVLVTEVEWLRKLLELDDEMLKPLDRGTLQIVLQTVLELIEWRFAQGQDENAPDDESPGADPATQEQTSEVAN